MNRYVVIMAGGVGTRFWPVSRVEKPKQFLDILGTGQSLLQLTIKRFLKIVPEENIYLVINKIYKDLVKEQWPNISEDQILCEPLAKNTAPCVAYACSKILAKDPKAVTVIAPSDHLITDTDDFVKQINLGLDFAENRDALVTLGIKPSRPDTGYGYIQFVNDEVDKGVHKVKTFTEKPNDEIAKQFMESGEFLWNAGIFIWKVKTIMNAFDEYLPDVSELFNQGHSVYFTDAETEYIENIYPICQSISIDYGIIEKAENVYILPSDFGWSDLGTWKSLYDVVKSEPGQNVIIGNDIDLHDSENNLVYNDQKKVIYLEGVKNLFVLDTKDALLVCNIDSEQEVKRIVGELKLKYKGDFI